MLTYNQRSAEIAMERLVSLFLGPKYNNLYGQDQETSSDEEIAKVEEFAGRAKMAISGAQRIQILEVIKEVETKSVIETKLVIGIETPLDMMTITSQCRKEDDQESYSEQDISTTPLIIIGRIRLQV